MKTLAMLVAALAASLGAGLLTAFALAEWADSDLGYILVFFGLALAMAVSVVVFLVAFRRPAPLQAIRRSGRTLLIVVVAASLLLGVNALTYGISVPIWRELKLVLALGATMAAAVAAQWLVFGRFAATWPDRPPISSPTGGASP